MNRVSAALEAEKQQSVLTKLGEIKEILSFCINLSPEERKGLPRLGDKSIAFVEQAGAMVSANPKMMPQDFDTEEFEKDAALFNAMKPIKLELDALYEIFDDTFIEVGSEAYTAALEVYRIAKARGKSAVLDNQLDALGKRFARKVKGNPPATETPSE